MGMSFRDHEFVTQYAIRMPDGTLFGSRTFNPAEHMMGPFMGGPGMLMMQMFGSDEDEDLMEEITTPPSVWYDRKEAERALMGIKQMMAQHGIEHWQGTIVERLCSPFTAPQEQRQLVEDVTQWLKSQSGQ